MPNTVSDLHLDIRDSHRSPSGAVSETILPPPAYLTKQAPPPPETAKLATAVGRPSTAASSPTQPKPTAKARARAKVDHSKHDHYRKDRAMMRARRAEDEAGH